MATNNTSTAGIGAAITMNFTWYGGILAFVLAAVAWVAGASIASTLALVGVLGVVATLVLFVYVLAVIRFVHGVPTRFEA